MLANLISSELLWTVLISSIPVLLVIAFATPLGEALDIIDKPDTVRKHHASPTPMVGGLAFFLAFIANLVFWQWTGGDGLGVGLPLTLSATIFFVVGLLDDRHHMRASLRLLILGVVAIAMCFTAPSLVIDELHFQSLGFSIPLGVLAIPFTVFTLLCFQNAANMADGVNGLFLGLTLVWTLLMAPWLHGAFTLYFGFVGFVALLLLAPNMRGRLFTGDSGTYLVAFLVCMGSISLYNSLDGALPADYMAVAFLIPVLDMGRMLITRILRGAHPFEADHGHVHHILIKITDHKPMAVAIYLALNLIPLLYFVIDGVPLWALMILQILAYGSVLTYQNQTAVAASETPGSD